MGIVNVTIPSLFNGVSQQPAQLRHTSQCESMENCYPVIATGLRKRPPTQHLAKITSIPCDDALVHIINRDVNERYIVIISNGDLKVFDLNTGLPKTVNFPDGKSYLSTLTPRSSFAVTTVADYSFILNKSVKVLGGVAAPARDKSVAYVTVNNAVTAVAYTVTVDTKRATFVTSSDTTLGTGTDDTGVTATNIVRDGADTTTIEKVALGLKGALTTVLGSGYTVSILNTSILVIKKNVGVITTSSVTDGFANQGLTLLSGGAVQLFSNLPAKFVENYTVQISGDPSSSYDNYFVTYKDGSWVETVEGGTVNSFNGLTMPHQLVRNSDGTFTFSKAVWSSRLAGNDLSNPPPSFLNSSINGLFFFRNRLGMLVDENVVLSRTGDYFNFWGATATGVLDTDPIDVSVSSTKVSILRHAIPFNKVLLLFSDQTQFQLAGGEVLTPKSCRADVVTTFESSIGCSPVSNGSDLYFITERGSHSALREYYVDADTVTNNAADSTAHVPHYLPANVFSLSASSSEDVIFALTLNERNAIYVYKYYWAKQEKMQSSWGKLLFAEGDVILATAFISSVCYLVIQRADGVYLESLDLQSGDTEEGLKFSLHLDRKFKATGSYNSSTDVTSWTLPYQISTTTPLAVVRGAGFVGAVGASLGNTLRPTTSSISAAGDYSGAPCVIGVPYVMSYVFSDQYVRDRDNNPVLSGKVKIKRWFIGYSDTGYFRAEVTPFGRDTYKYPFTSQALGTSKITLGTPSVSSGSMKFPVLAENIGVKVEIINDTPMPCNIQTAEWDGEYVIHGQRV